MNISLRLTVVPIILSQFFFTLAWANRSGGQDGNGGDVSVCRNGTSITSVELLDYFEARESRRWPIKLDDKASWKANLQILLSRIGDRDLEFKNELQLLVDTFENETQFIRGVELVDVPDSQHLIIPSGCKIEQIAIQRAPQFKNDPYYTINDDYWSLMKSSNQAGLVLHEVLYRYYLKKLRGTNSTVVRYFNGLIASDQFSGLSVDDYFEILAKVGVTKARVGTMRVEIPYFGSGKKSGAETYKVETLQPTEFNIGHIVRVNVHGRATIKTNGRWDGNVTYLESANVVQLNISQKGLETADTAALSANPVNFKFNAKNDKTLSMDGIFWIVSQLGHAYRCHSVVIEEDSGALHCSRTAHLGETEDPIWRTAPKHPDQESLKIIGNRLTELRLWGAFMPSDIEHVGYRYSFDRNLKHTETWTATHSRYYRSYTCPAVFSDFDKNDFPHSMKIVAERACASTLYKLPVQNYVNLQTGQRITHLDDFEFVAGAELKFSKDGYYGYSPKEIRLTRIFTRNYSDIWGVAIQNQNIALFLSFSTLDWDEKIGECLKKSIQSVSFYPNGRVKQGVVAPWLPNQRFALKTKSGTTVKVVPFDVLHFDENGELLKVVDDLCSRS